MAFTKIQINKATAKVEEFLHKQLDDPKTEVLIYTWPDFKTYGIRVAEVSFWLPGPNNTKDRPQGAGSSFMQVDPPHGGAVCFYAERLILDYLHGDFEDEINDDKWRLCQAAFEKDPK